MPAGRPHELTADLVNQVGTLLPRVLYLETVADGIGVHRDTLRKWVKAGGKESRRRERGKPPDASLDLHVELIGVVKKAMCDWQANCLAGIMLAAEEGAWQANAWQLERRSPEQWSATRKELQELQAKLDALTKAVRDGNLKAADPPGGTTPPGRRKPG